MTENQTFNAQNFKARCSAIHAVMANSRNNPQLTEKQAERLAILENKVVLTQPMQEEMAELLVKKENGKKIILSDGCIAYLMEEYTWQRSRKVRVEKNVMDIPQMKKGICVEPESLDLLCVVDGKVYKENRLPDGSKQRVYNEYLSGEVDAYLGEDIMSAEAIPDVKSIWDAPTYYCKTVESLTVANDWQLKGYSDITGAKQVFVANCLVNAPEHIIYDYRQRLLRSMLNSQEIISEESPLYLEKAEILENSLRFDDLPRNERVFKKPVELMSENQRQLLYDKVKACRDYLFEYDKWIRQLNK